MIKPFTHKGLKKFWQEGSIAGIQAKHAVKLEFILDRLDGAGCVEDANFHGANLHPLKVNLKEHWSIAVNGN